MYKKHEIGKKGEKIAEKYLKEHGYKILEKNFLCLRGEIDIIALDKKEIVIIEVKTRTNNKYGAPAEAVDFRKQKHIYNAAEYYLYCTKRENECVRFDVIEIFMKESGIQVNHIKKVIL